VNPGRLRVLVAGGGVAGIEVILALGNLARDRVEATLLDPAEEFVYKPLLVAEPFGVGEPVRLQLPGVARDAGARFVQDGLAEVDDQRSTVRTAGGATLEYDALVVAVGGRPVEAVAGAVTFGDRPGRERFSGLLAALGRRGTQRVLFAVPPGAEWPIVAYELALLTAAERAARALRGVELEVVTHETAPLGLLGAPASALVRARLAEADVRLRTSARAVAFAAGRLELVSGDPVAADAAVALPLLEVARIRGLPQDDRGFLAVDERMNVPGMPRVWAVGDATASLIKQGGLAAQQADLAARAIATLAGARVPVEPVQPVLRAELVTGRAPAFLRGPASGAAAEVATGTPLWAPAAKVAGRYLAPYVASKVTGDALGEVPEALEDRPAPADAAGEAAVGEEALRLLLAAADSDARAGQFALALEWLELVEQLDLVIPAEYVTRRDDWRGQIEPGRDPDPAAARIDPSRTSAVLALSDLERRIGWLREMEARGAADMGGRLHDLEDGLEQVRDLSRRAGLLK